MISKITKQMTNQSLLCHQASQVIYLINDLPCLTWFCKLTKTINSLLNMVLCVFILCLHTDTKVVEHELAKEPEFEEVVEENEEQVFHKATPEALVDSSANPKSHQDKPGA